MIVRVEREIAVQDDYLQLLDLVYQVAQSLEGKEHPDHRMHDCNQLAAKLFFHAATICWLRQGTKAPVPPQLDGADFYDFPTVAIIARATLETYLTMFEVFFENIPDDEQEFRHAVWQLSGFVIREGTVLQDLVIPERRAESQGQIDEMRTRIQNTAFFASLTTGQQNAVLRGERQPRAFEDRLGRAGFAHETVRTIHRYLSGFVHSDGLAGVQIMWAVSAARQIAFIESHMRIVMVVMAKMIREYRKAFPSAEAWCLAKAQAAHLADVYSGAGALLDLLR